MEQQSLLSLIFYDNDLVKSHNCYLLNEDLIEITLEHDSNIVGSVVLNSAQVKSIISSFNNDTSGDIIINDIQFKRSFIKNLEIICE